MKKSKIFWLVALLVMSVAAVEAQECPENREKRENCPGKARIERMAQELDLTPEQRSQIEKLHGEKMQRMAQNRAAHEADMARMKEILTPEQFAKWEQGMKQMNPGHHKKGHGPHKGMGPKGDSMKGCCKKDGCKTDRKPCCPTAKQAPKK